jgi:aldehyde:ferredoxin oxidoreductase
MMKGYTGKILHVNLTTEEFRVEQPGEDFYRKYLGGSCLGTYYVMQNIQKGIDPLSANNVLVFSVGPIAGSGISGSSRHSVTTKSPQTGGIITSEGGGYWSHEIRWAGFDAVVIQGAATRPVYLWIHDGEYELREATQLWGKTTKEAQTAIREELNDNKIRVAQIGPAGENLCLYANIVNELGHYNGRGGVGAVMGAKKLRAIAVRGLMRPDFADSEGLKAFAKRGVERIRTDEGLRNFKQNGTHNVVIENSGLGGLPTRNWTSGYFEGQEELMPDAWNEAIIKPGTCQSCAQSCKRHIDGSKSTVLDPAYGGPEYETVGMCGSNLGIADKIAICLLNEICGKYAMDTISFGASLSFVMECYEKGIITSADTDGIDCHFGNIESAVKIAELTGRNEGFGREVAQGSAYLAKKFGKDSENLLITVKKKEFPAHMPQTKAAVGLGYALVPFGADHCSIEMDPSISAEPLSEQMKSFAFDRAEDPYEMNLEKAKLLWRTQRAYTLTDTASVCLLAFGFGMAYGFDDLVESINLATGWQTNLFELMLIGERCLHMMRAFNACEGFTTEDDVLPEKMYAPLAGGKTDGLAMDREAFRQAREFYYAMAGWNSPDYAPSRYKLLEMNLDWVVDYLAKA